MGSVLMGVPAAWGRRQWFGKRATREWPFAAPDYTRRPRPSRLLDPGPYKKKARWVRAFE